MAFTVKETIGYPRDHVWTAATNWANAPLWMKGVEELRIIGDEPVGEGARLGFRARSQERESTIVGWVPGERLALRSLQGGITADYQYTFEDCVEGTRVTLAAECRGESLGWRLLAPLIGFLMARADEGQLRALKTMIEGQETVAERDA